MSSVEITKKAKSTVLEQKVNQYEQSMKDKFIEVMQIPGTKYADCLDYIESEIKQSKRWLKSITAFSVLGMMVFIN